MGDRRCDNCHYGRSTGTAPHFKWWCALRRLADPKGIVTVQMAWPHHYRFDGHEPTFTVSRSKSPGFAEGWSRDWRSGERQPHDWNDCREFVPTTTGARHG